MEGSSWLKDAIAFLGAIGVLVALIFVLEMNAILSLVLAVLVFVGLFLIFNPKIISDVVMQRRYSDSPTTFRIKISQMRNLSGAIDKYEVRESLQKVCELSSAIALEIERKPMAPRYIISKMNQIFQMLTQALGQYMHGKGSAAEKDALAARLESDVLNELETTLQTYLQDLDRADITQLQVIVATLQEILSDK